MQLPTDLDATARAAILALADEMERHGRGREGPVRTTSAYVGDRWSALVLLVLQTGTWRHADLRRVMSTLSSEGAISQRVLTLKLRALERDGFVGRTVSADVPPRVSYALTALGRALTDELRGLIDWIKTNEDAIKAARVRFDAGAADR